MSTETSANSAQGTAVVTGALSGLGKVYADRLAKRGYDLILIARRGDRLEELARQLRKDQGVSVADLPVLQLNARERGCPAPARN